MTNSPSLTIKIPDGLRPGDVPNGINWSRRIWLILPEKNSGPQPESVRRVRSLLASRDGISISDARVRSVKGTGGRDFRLLPPNEVAGIYKAAHRERVAIIAFCGTKVLLDISELPTNHGCMALGEFIRYKCYYTLVSRLEEAESAVLSAVAWMDNIECEGHHDPRCLPAAIFKAREEYPLETSPGRQRFIARHKDADRSNSLTDALDRAWQVGDYHTRDILQVAGSTLPIGFHWDVQSDRKSSTIATGWETWRLPGKGYVNIHPDAHIRGGNAHKTHSLATGAPDEKQPKTPRRSRKAKSRQKI